MPEYSPAPEADKIGRRLIQKHHDHLDGVRVDFVFRDKAAKAGGKTVYGKARKIAGLNAYLADREESLNPEDFFVIELARDVWTILSKEQRVALVDHELCHCGVEVEEGSDELKLVVLPHQIEAFHAEVERHGLWDTDLEHFAKTIEERRLEQAEQLTLDEAASTAADDGKAAE